MSIAGNETSGRETVKSPQIFILEDQPLFRLGVCTYVKEQPGLSCCGESACDDDSVFSVEPDVILLGASRNDPGGIETMADLRTHGVAAKIVILAQAENKAQTKAAVRLGASGVLIKNEPLEVLGKAIRATLDGEIFVSENLKASLFSPNSGKNEDSNSDSDPESESESALDRLTKREVEVLGLMGSGLMTSKIATRLGISPKTIDVHRANIKKKLGINNVNGLISFAARYFG